MVKDRKVKTVVCDKVECERWCVTKEDGVCVYIIGADHSGDCTQRSYPLVLEAESDQLCVPAISILFYFHSVFRHGNRPSLEPASRFDFQFFSALLSKSGTVYGQ